MDVTASFILCQYLSMVSSTSCRFCGIWKLFLKVSVYSCFICVLQKADVLFLSRVCYSWPVSVQLYLQLCQTYGVFFLFIDRSLDIKGMFLYITLSSPQDCSKRFTLYFPDRPVHSDTTSASHGSIQPYATINARRLLVQLTNTLYNQVLIYTAE